jgi:hypothetical protein
MAHLNSSSASPVTIRIVIGGALGLYRMIPGRIALTAAVVFLPIDGVTIFLHGTSTHLLEIRHTGLALVAEAIAAFLITAGQVFLAGVLDDLVGERLENRPSLSVAEAFRQLRLRRLIVADMLVSISAGVAALAFVIPGIIVFALFGIVGSIINVEDRGIVDSMRRSARLVRPHLWVACAVIVVPFGVELGVENWFLSFAHAVPWLATLVVGVVLSVTMRAMIGLLEVILGHSLIHGSRAVTSKGLNPPP